MTVTVEEDQINTPDCSPGAFIRQDNWYKFYHSVGWAVGGWSEKAILCQAACAVRSVKTF